MIAGLNEILGEVLILVLLRNPIGELIYDVFA